MREDGSSCGIIHLYNCPQPIRKINQKKFDAMRKTFGGMIENIESKTQKLTTVIAIEMAKESARKAVEAGLMTVTDNGTIQAYVNLLKPFDAMEHDLGRVESSKKEMGLI